jgi:hypothetical protein
MIHEQDRHESSRSPDIDNILKPILDAMQGPDGIMVNDSQVQELSCRWIDWPAREQRLDLHLRFLPDEWARKDGLIFVRMSPTLCMPLNRQIPAEGILLMLEVWERQFNTRTELIASGWDYYQANSVMSIQRPFHISRLLGFTVLPLDELRKELIAANQASAVPTQPQKEPLP